MDKWFEGKFQNKNARDYTRRHLDDNASRGFGFSRRFSITLWLIIVNVLVFFIVSVLVGVYGEEQIFNYLALKPHLLFSGFFWTLFTSMFLHGGIEHLLANMVSLFFVGSFVEKVIGRKRYLWFYILAGIFAGIFYAILSFLFGASGIGEKIFFSPDVFAVGASGAIFGLLGLLAVLVPRSKIYLIAGPILAIVLEFAVTKIYTSSAINLVLGFLVTFYFIFSVFAIFSFNPKMIKLTIPWEMPMWVLPIIAIVPLIIIGLFVPLPIGNTAHLGGLIAGLIYGSYLKKKYRHKTVMLSRMFR